MTPTLTWQPNQNAIEQMLYVGLTYADVDAATPDPTKVFVIPCDNVTTSVGPVGPIECEKTYYWRVDEVDRPTTFTGRCVELYNTNCIYDYNGDGIVNFKDFATFASIGC